MHKFFSISFPRSRRLLIRKREKNQASRRGLTFRNTSSSCSLTASKNSRSGTGIVGGSKAWLDNTKERRDYRTGLPWYDCYARMPRIVVSVLNGRRCIVMSCPISLQQGVSRIYSITLRSHNQAKSTTSSTARPIRPGSTIKGSCLIFSDNAFDASGEEESLLGRLSVGIGVLRISVVLMRSNYFWVTSNSLGRQLLKSREINYK